MIKFRTGLMVGTVLCFTSSYTQTGNLTSSPYSLFGLGRQNEIGSGKTNALGKSGLALGSETEINSLNPASFASIPKDVFFFDIGLINENSRYTGTRDNQANSSSNFSNFSMALSFSEKSAIGVSLFPYTSVGYNIDAVNGFIEGTPDFYTSNITGSGGLNIFQLNYGRKITNRLNLGIRANYYFGKITEVENVDLQGNYLTVDENHNYKGIQFAIGAQYQLHQKLGFGLVVNLPASLSGSKDRTVTSLVDGTQRDIETSDSKIKSFKMPLDAGLGTKYIYKNLTFNMDYKISFWEGINEDDTSIGSFADQHYFAGGVEYLKGGRSYFENMRFRLGGTYDTGYMAVQGSKISNTAVTVGVGLPLSLRGNTFLNLSYSYGQRGQVSNTLIRENYHLISLNLSLGEKWFVRRLLD